MSHALSLPSEVAILLPQGEHGPALATQFTVAMGQEGQVVGELRLRTTRQQACSAFRYCSSQLNRRYAHMVSPELRPTLSSQWTTRPSHECRNTFAALADTAPAGFGLAVLQRAQERGLLDCFRPSEQEPTPWDALCMVPDLARMGALRLLRPHRPAPDEQQASLLLPREADLGGIAAAARAFEQGQEDLRQLLLLLYCTTALPGARPKCTFVQGDRQLAVATFPSTADSHPVNRLQVLIAQIAQFVGIHVPSYKLLHSISTPIVLTPRFDRGAGGERIPFLSAQSLLLANPDDVIDHTELLATMREYCQDFTRDARQLWLRLLFIWLLNHDGLDLRKVGFLNTGGGRWRLAPACGLLPHLNSQAEQKQQPQRALWLHTDLRQLLEKASDFQIGRAQARQMLQNQLDALSNWRTLAKLFTVCMTSSDLELIQPLMDNPHVQFAREWLKNW